MYAEKPWLYQAPNPHRNLDYASALITVGVQEHLSAVSELSAKHGSIKGHIEAKRYMRNGAHIIPMFA
jgi:hypothetical protein